MSSALLREAAGLMRERAEVASPAPWWRDGFTVRGGSDGRSVAPAHNASLANAEHIASWHPAVALAVADWLDSVADAYEPPDGGPGNRGRTIANVDGCRATWGDLDAEVRTL